MVIDIQGDTYLRFLHGVSSINAGQRKLSDVLITQQAALGFFGGKKAVGVQKTTYSC